MDASEYGSFALATPVKADPSATNITSTNKKSGFLIPQYSMQKVYTTSVYLLVKGKAHAKVKTRYSYTYNITREANRNQCIYCWHFL